MGRNQVRSREGDLAGERLRSWRTARGLSLVALAELLGISFPYVSKIEKGHRNPSLSLAILIEKESGIRVESWPHLSCVSELISRRFAEREAA